MSDSVHLILVRSVPVKIIKIWVNKLDSEHEHGKWLALDKLSKFCDMFEHISDIYGQYEKIAESKAAELREKSDCENISRHEAKWNKFRLIFNL